MELKETIVALLYDVRFGARAEGIKDSAFRDGFDEIIADAPGNSCL